MVMMKQTTIVIIIASTAGKKYASAIPVGVSVGAGVGSGGHSTVNELIAFDGQYDSLPS